MPSGRLAGHSSELLRSLPAVLLGLHKPLPFWAASPSDGWGSWRHGCRAQRCRWARAGRRPGTPSEFWHQGRNKAKTIELLPLVLHFLFHCGWPEPSVTKQHRLQKSSHPSQEVDCPRPVRRFAPNLSEEVWLAYREPVSTVLLDYCSSTWKGPWMFLKHFSSKSWPLSGSPSSSQPIANIPWEIHFQESIFHVFKCFWYFCFEFSL